jgi:hypothetical protein
MVGRVNFGECTVEAFGSADVRFEAFSSADVRFEAFGYGASKDPGLDQDRAGGS